MNDWKIAIDPLAWDSDFFGFPVARLAFHGELVLADAIIGLKVTNTRLAYLDVASGADHTPTQQIDARRCRRTQPQS